MPDRPVRAAAIALLLGLMLVGAPAVLAQSASVEPPTLRGEGRVDPGVLRVTVFARGLLYPYGMAELADGSLLVGTSLPTEGSFFVSTGELLRLVDEDGDGVADGPGTALASGLPGPLTAVRRAGGLVYAVSVRSGAERIGVFRVGAGAADPLVPVGEIAFSYETPMEHGTYEVAVREVPGEPDQHELLFNVGSVGNVAAGATVTVSGLVAAKLADAAVYRIAVDDGGEAPVFSAPEVIATGLRNAAGLAVDRESGDLYLADNGIDTPEDRVEALSADELNRIATEDVGGAAEEFGFPTEYVAYRSGRRVGPGMAAAPLVAFRPLDGSENEGAVQIAVAPPGFPTGLNDGLFVGFHGQSDAVGLANEENPLAYVDVATGEYFHLIGNDEPGIGHLDGLLATADALYVADLTGIGSVIGTEALGVIYQIAPARAATGTNPP